MKLEANLRSTNQRAPQWLAWALGATLVLVLAFCDLASTHNGRIADHVYWGRDFINLWTGGHLVREGRLDLLYDLRGYAAYQKALVGPISLHNYSYPPVSFPIAAMFSLLPYWLSLISWMVGTGALFVLACRRWWPNVAGPVWLAVLTPAAVVNIWAGHYGFFVGALFLFGWQWLDEHPRRAGFAFGLMLIKPHLAVLVPLALVMRREWSALISAALTCAALVISTTLYFGWQPWSDFLFRTTVAQASMIDAGQIFYGVMSTSAATAMMQLGFGWGPALALQAVLAAGAMALVSIAARNRMQTRELAFLVATCTFVVLPYAFNYDMTVVCVGALALMNTPRVRAGDYRLGVYGFLAPQLGMVTAAFAVSLTPLITCFLAIAQYRAWAGRGADPAIPVPQAEPSLAPALN